MDNPAVLVLLLEQGDRSLEDHTEDFVFLANYTHYPDNCLSTFYRAGLNTTTREQLSGDGPRESLAAFIEWVLVSCKSKLTVDIADNDTSPTRDPEPSQPPPHSAELFVPTADREPEPAASVEPSQPERQSRRSPRSLSPKCLTRCESRQFQQRWIQLWRSRGLWNALPTAPPLGVSIYWTWETS